MQNNSPLKTYERLCTKQNPLQTTTRNGELVIEFENVCRLCLKTSNKMFDVFKADISLVPLFVKIRILLNLSIVEEEEELPRKICERCYVYINGINQFKNSCLANDIRLRQCLIKVTPKQQVSKHSWNDTDSKDICLNQLYEKNDCTYEWDDQVPLAGFILSNNENSTIPMKHITNPCIELSHTTVLKPTEELAENDKLSNGTVMEKKDKNEPRFCVIDFDNLPLADRLKIDMIKNKNIKSVTRKQQILSEKMTCLHCKRNIPLQLISKGIKRRCLKKCPYCPKSFLINSNMNRHLGVHTGERPFHCKHCQVSFTQKVVLSHHIQCVHYGRRPFACKYCDKTFSASYILKVHLRSSHKYKACYKCEHCSKTFLYPSSLSRHRKFHSEKRYICDKCLKRFTDYSSFKRHFKKLHNITVE